MTKKELLEKLANETDEFEVDSLFKQEPFKSIEKPEPIKTDTVVTTTAAELYRLYDMIIKHEHEETEKIEKDISF